MLAWTNASEPFNKYNNYSLEMNGIVLDASSTHWLQKK